MGDGGGSGSAAVVVVGGEHEFEDRQRPCTSCAMHMMRKTSYGANRAAALAEEWVGLEARVARGHRMHGARGGGCAAGATARQGL
mmetsp:Transcript_23001/g.53182  ORF Transcript_23001/g.53182 Transcript_23001/m.53182 type:complete len:85 (-) Transcript_23001:2150-2404(-)